MLRHLEPLRNRKANMSASPFASDPNPYQAPTESRLAAGLPGGGQWATPTVIELLSQTRPWVLFLSIIGFLVAGLCVVGGVFGAIAIAGAALGGVERATILIVYPLIGVIYFFPSLYLFRCSRAIRDLRDTHDVLHLENALRAQKSFWRFCGIVVALVIALYGVMLVMAVIAGTFVMLR